MYILTTNDVQTAFTKQRTFPLFKQSHPSRTGLPGFYTVMENPRRSSRCALQRFSTPRIRKDEAMQTLNITSLLSIKYFPKIARGSINLKLVKIFYFKHHCSQCLESAGLASLQSYVLCLSPPFPLPVEMFKLEGFNQKTF